MTKAIIPEDLEEESMGFHQRPEKCNSGRMLYLCGKYL